MESNYNMGADYTREMRNNYGMYTDEATMYTHETDILSFEDHHAQKPEFNKHPSPIPIDPWLVDQAGVSDIKFPATDAASSSDLFGRLSPTMEEIANSLLPNEENLPLFDNPSFAVDILDSVTPEVSNVKAKLGRGGGRHIKRALFQLLLYIIKLY